MAPIWPLTDPHDFYGVLSYYKQIQFLAKAYGVTEQHAGRWDNKKYGNPIISYEKLLNIFMNNKNYLNYPNEEISRSLQTGAKRIVSRQAKIVGCKLIPARRFSKPDKPEIAYECLDDITKLERYKNILLEKQAAQKKDVDRILLELIKDLEENYVLWLYQNNIVFKSNHTQCGQGSGAIPPADETNSFFNNAFTYFPTAINKIYPGKDRDTKISWTKNGMVTPIELYEQTLEKLIEKVNEDGHKGIKLSKGIVWRHADIVGCELTPIEHPEPDKESIQLECIDDFFSLMDYHKILLKKPSRICWKCGRGIINFIVIYFCFKSMLAALASYSHHLPLA